MAAVRGRKRGRPPARPGSAVIPLWLHLASIASLAVAAACALVVVVDEVRHPQRMGVMNVVWPVTSLFGSLVALWAYFRYGRATDKHTVALPVAVAKSATHCGSGCTLGDICAEWLAFAVPAVATWFGWGWAFSEKVFAVWVLDYVLAFAFGILFQYFTIVPMRHLGWREGILRAVQADALSLTAWQVGMYGFMAFANFYLFRHILGARLEVASFEFWAMMQLAMVWGFATAYPVNWWLVRAGIKERM